MVLLIPIRVTTDHRAAEAAVRSRCACIIVFLFHIYLCMFDICQYMKQLVRYDMLSDDCRFLPYNVTVVIWNYKNKTELNFGFAAIFLLLVTE